MDSRTRDPNGGGWGNAPNRSQQIPGRDHNRLDSWAKNRLRERPRCLVAGLPVEPHRAGSWCNESMRPCHRPTVEIARSLAFHDTTTLAVLPRCHKLVTLLLRALERPDGRNVALGVAGKEPATRPTTVRLGRPPDRVTRCLVMPDESPFRTPAAPWRRK